MTSTEQKNKFSLIASIIYIAITVYGIITKIIYVNSPEYVPVSADTVIGWIALIGLAVTLFIKNKKAVLFAAGVYVLLGIYYLAIWFDLWNFLNLLAYAAFVVIIILAIKKSAIVKKIWFIAGALLFIGLIVYWIRDGWNLISSGYFMYILEGWQGLFTGIAEIIALVCAGIWLKNDEIPG